MSIHLMILMVCVMIMEIENGHDDDDVAIYLEGRDVLFGL